MVLTLIQGIKFLGIGIVVNGMVWKVVACLGGIVIKWRCLALKVNVDKMVLSGRQTGVKIFWQVKMSVSCVLS